MRDRRVVLVPLLLLGLVATALAVAPPAVVESAGLARARSHARDELSRLVSEWIAIAEIPAPSGHEGARRDKVRKLLADAGLEPEVDAHGNLSVELGGGRDADPEVVFVAHLDQVAVDAATPIRVRRDDGWLEAPGICDDAAGVAALVAAARALSGSGLELAHPLVFLFTTGEEAGLEGIRAFLDERSVPPAAVVTIDSELGEVSVVATGVRWYRFPFRAAGAHTLDSRDRPSTTHAVALAIADLYALPIPRGAETARAWLNVGMIGGGEVPNAQCRDCWFTVDLRADAPAELEALDAKVVEIGRHAADLVGVDFEAEVVFRSDGAQLPGLADHPLARAAGRALEEAGVHGARVVASGSSDSNEALRRGIPAITIGVTQGRGIHTPDEGAEIAPIEAGLDQVVVLAALLAGR